MIRPLALYPATVAVLLVLLPLAAPRSGPLTLANIFSVHLALAALLLVPAAAVRGDRVLRASLLALAMVAAVRFGGEWVSAPSSATTSGDLFTTASWNLELGARPGSAAADAIEALDVDVVALQELGPDHARAIQASKSVTDAYPHRELHPEAGVFGMGLLSRHPIRRAEYRRDPALIEAVIDDGGRRVTLINAHPLAGRLDMAGPIPVGFDSTGRDERLGRIRTRVEDAIGRGESVIILGDLNATPFEPGFLELVEGLHDAHAEVGQGPGWTWRPSRLEWAGLGVIRIDHALSSPRITPVSSGEDCRRPGDHCMLETSFSIANAGGRFDVRFPAVGDVAELPVSIHDGTGLVFGVEPAVSGQIDRIARHAARLDTLLVSWTGGICDRRAEVAIVRVGSSIRIAVKSEPTCGLLAGRERTLAVRFAQPIDPSLVTVEDVS